MSKSMVHLNGDLVCCVDTETTGLVAGKHDLLQVCVLPLDSDLQILRMEGLTPFYINLQPKRPENADPDAFKVNGLRLADFINDGIDPWRAADLFDEWFKKLGLAVGKKIAPLGANYGFDKSFLIDWLGSESYEACFSHHVRDIQATALYLNDRADFMAEKVPFPKVNVKYLASQLEIPHERAHDALQDCVVEAEIYRRMVMGQFQAPL